MAKAILSFQESAKSAMASGALLNDAVNAPARSDLMRGRFLRKDISTASMKWSRR